MESTLAGKPKRKGKPYRHTIAQVADALKEAHGAIAVAAKSLGLNRSSLWRRVSKNEMLSSIVADSREELCDLAESKLMEAIEDGAPWAISLVLKTLGKSRGYAERVETKETEPPKPDPMESWTDEQWHEYMQDQCRKYLTSFDIDPKILAIKSLPKSSIGTMTR